MSRLLSSIEHFRSLHHLVFAPLVTTKLISVLPLCAQIIDLTTLRYTTFLHLSQNLTPLSAQR